MLVLGVLLDLVPAVVLVLAVGTGVLRLFAALGVDVSGEVLARVVDLLAVGAGVAFGGPAVRVGQRVASGALRPLRRLGRHHLLHRLLLLHYRLLDALHGDEGVRLGQDRVGVAVLGVYDLDGPRRDLLDQGFLQI